MKSKKESYENPVIKMGMYPYPVRSYLSELLLKSQDYGLTFSEICKKTGRYNVNGGIVFNCLCRMTEDDEAELFIVIKGNKPELKYKFKKRT